MIWPFSRCYPLITLQWFQRTGFWVLWDFNQTHRENLMILRYTLRTLISAGTGGSGCVCGYEEPLTRRWPGWFWHNRYWDAHVQTCPLERDEQGNVIDWKGYR